MAVRVQSVSVRHASQFQWGWVGRPAYRSRTLETPKACLPCKSVNIERKLQSDKDCQTVISLEGRWDTAPDMNPFIER